MTLEELEALKKKADDLRQIQADINRLNVELDEMRTRRTEPKTAEKGEVKTMKHKDFSGYLGDMRAIQESSAAEYTALNEKIKAARETWKRQQKDGADDEKWLTYRKAEYLEAEDVFKVGMEDLQKRTRESIDAIRGELQEHLSGFYTPNGAMLDDDVVKLLHSGLKLSQAEYNGLIEQNRHNPTMIRLLSDFGEDHKLATDISTTFGVLAKHGGKDELEVFDHLRQYVENGVRDDMGHVWQGHFERAYNDSIAKMDSMTIKPE